MELMKEKILDEDGVKKNLIFLKEFFMNSYH